MFARSRSSLSAEDFAHYLEGIVGREVRSGRDIVCIQQHSVIALLTSPTAASGRVRAPVQIPVSKPFNWVRALIALAVVALTIYRAPTLYGYLEPVLKRPTVWAIIATVRCCLERSLRCDPALILSGLRTRTRTRTRTGTRTRTRTRTRTGTGTRTRTRTRA